MVIYPDLEMHLVAYLNAALAEIGNELAADVRVATIKAPADMAQPAKQVVVTANYGRDLDPVRKEATGLLDVYASDYATANSLALLIAALVGRAVGDPIKRAELSVGPLRVTEDGPNEKRSISVDFVVKGSEYAA